jgi:hypothetical protein
MIECNKGGIFQRLMEDKKNVAKFSSEFSLNDLEEAIQRLFYGREKPRKPTRRKQKVKRIDGKETNNTLNTSFLITTW